MKKFLLTLSIAIASYFSYAQNTFPGTGNAGVGTNSPSTLLDIRQYGTNNLYSPLITVAQPDGSMGGTVGTRAISADARQGLKISSTANLTLNGANTSTNPAIQFQTGTVSAENSDANTAMTILGNGNVGIGTSTPNGVFHINNNVSYSDNSNNQFVLTNGGYRNSESGTLQPDNAGMAYYFTNYNAGGKVYDRTLDLRVRGASDGTFGAGMIRFFANDYAGGSTEREIMRVHGNGNVGIGTTNPNAKLDILGSGKLLSMAPTTATDAFYVMLNNDNAHRSIIGQDNSTGSGLITSGSPYAMTMGTLDAFPMVFATNTNERMRILSNGNILIGKISQTNTVYKLDINGSARANEIVVNTTGADFVFEPDYKLPKLSEVKTYIDQNHHLPEIPSAKEMQTNGMNVGELNTRLLQKVEELTLYLIEKDREVTEQGKQLSEQQKKNEQQEVRMRALEAAVSKLTAISSN